MLYYQKIDSYYIKSSIEIRQINFLSKKLIHTKEKVCLRLNYLTFKVVPKNNPWSYSLQQNKKAGLTTAVYFKASSPVKPQGQ